ncbi:MAG: hypothetical protein VX992_07820, partial [Acidobacteriota bacterium]|nr:hypothetical protein [Acidobacteriota bacterium]
MAKRAEDAEDAVAADGGAAAAAGDSLAPLEEDVRGAVAAAVGLAAEKLARLIAARTGSDAEAGGCSSLARHLEQ